MDSIGNFGVRFFFVISGFLITGLLLQEFRNDGGVDLARFYLRRSLRIFPAFYAYLAVLGILALLNIIELQRFDAYWDGPAYLDRVIAREVTEPTVRLTGLRTGELHMINDIPADRMKEVKGDAKFQVQTWSPLNWDFVNLNHEFEPFKIEDDFLGCRIGDFGLDQLGQFLPQRNVCSEIEFPVHRNHDGVAHFFDLSSH